MCVFIDLRFSPVHGFDSSTYLVCVNVRVLFWYRLRFRIHHAM